MSDSTASIECVAVTPGLWALSDRTRSRYLGKIEQNDRLFHAFDSDGRDLGVFVSLRLAQQRIEEHTDH
ncbi:hypothetical protein [Schumannella soli]|uniref:Uncharacterized protein n=1 Tax=Schumannella soli TaxID=2590779 RepID=A0A506YCB6_9MICO|nr:hypothetical protein [Schumannella soli]TPW78079.1 hypothetical protein FJ657_05485 [Schumannella soli]